MTPTRFSRSLLPIALLALVWLIARTAGPNVVIAQAAERDLYVSVLDQSGRPVTDLGADAFVVREDGVRREVLRVRRASAPMQIALLVDNSEAMEPSIRHLRDALTAFVGALHQNNQIALITLGDRPTIRVEYTSNLDELKRGIGYLFAQSGSGMYLLDGIIETSRGLQKREARRPVIVTVTTEGPEFSTAHYQTVIDGIAKAGAALHTLLLIEGAGANALNEEVRNRNIVLDRGTHDSGGRRDQIMTSMAFEPRLKALADELNNQYLVTYARPQSLIQPEKIEVTAANPALKARGTPVRSDKGV